MQLGELHEIHFWTFCTYKIARISCRDTLVTDSGEILNVWQEHFETVFSKSVYLEPSRENDLLDRTLHLYYLDIFGMQLVGLGKSVLSFDSSMSISFSTTFAILGTNDMPR
jgi:hypothetical protein